MTKRVFLAVALCLAASCLCVPARAGDGKLDLKARLPDDPNIATRGVLPNGMRYWIRPHDNPKGAVDLTLYVEAGSIHETDEQRGYAHFVEHMAFNGTKHFPPGEAVRYFTSVGIEFGHHSNAYTGHKGTQYTMLLHDTSSVGLRRALLLFSDAAQHIGFLPAEVEQEKRVILEELRLRQDLDYRQVQGTLSELLPGSRLATRNPLGDAASVKKATPAGLRDFYRRWYRPDRATLLVVGDVQPQAIEVLVAEAFGDWANPDEALPVVEAGPWPGDGLRVAVLTDEDAQTAHVGLFCARRKRRSETIRDLRDQYTEQLAIAMMNWRAARQLQADPHLMTRATLYREVPFPGLEVYSWRSSTHSSTWAAALEALLLELRRVELHGFTAAEFEQICTAMLAQTRISGAGHMSRIGERLLDHVEAGTRPVDRNGVASLTQRLVKTITAADCAAAVMRLCDPRRGLIRVALPEVRPEWVAAVRSEAREIQAAVARTDVRPLDVHSSDMRSAEDAPKTAGGPTIGAAEARTPAPGEIVSKTHHEELGITTWTLGNGARVHFKRLPLEGDVHVSATLLGGAVEETRENRGITAITKAALQPGRLTIPGWERMDLLAHLAGRGVTVAATVDNQGLVLTVDAQREGLPEALRWLRVILTEARLDPHILRACKQGAVNATQKLAADASAVAWVYLNWFMSGQDVRTEVPRPETLDGITMDEARAWMDRLLHAAPLEIGIFADLDEQVVEHLVSTWVGSLPARTGRAEAVRDLWQMAAPMGPVTEKAEVVRGKTGAALLMWRALPQEEVVGGAALRHAATILGWRLRRVLREEHGFTYTLQTDYVTSDYAGVGGLFAEVTVDPARAEIAARMAKEIAVALAKEGPTKEELEHCQKQWRTQLEMAGGRVGLWRSMIDPLRHDVRNLAYYAPSLAALRTVDGKLMTKLLREIVRDERFFQILALPCK